MRLFVLGIGLELPLALKHHAEIRVWAALQRFAKRVLSVTVRLEDRNGPRGGVDKCCRMEVRLDRIGSLVAEHTAADARAAIDGAALRLKQAVTRRVKRRWQNRRRSAAIGRQVAAERMLTLA